LPIVRPFRGLRYTRAAGELAHVVAPPYDIISEDARRALHERSPHNIVRIELGYDAPDRDRYAESARLLRDWQTSGVLAMDPTASFYLHEQTFLLPPGVRGVHVSERRSRLALHAAVGLVPWSQGSILPHERTLSAAKEDRLRLISTCQANVSPVFGIASDPAGALERALREMKDRATPLGVVSDGGGQEHRLWSITEPDDIARIEAALAADTITIADGHHRYETSLAYRDAARQRSAGWSDDHPANSVLMAIVSAHSDALAILPIHRVIAGVDRARRDALSRSLAEAFDVEHVPLRQGTPADLDALLSRLASEPDTQFAVYIGGDTAYALRLRHAGDSSPVGSLGVTRLHTHVLRDLLEIDTDTHTGQSRVSYTTAADEATGAVRAGRADLAVLMQGCTMRHIERVARAGETMPQKSTYFYPKLPTGLVLRRIDDAGS